MKFRILFFSLLICLMIGSTSKAVAVWTDRSGEIPGTVLDPHVQLPYFSIAASRGDEWLVGNANQLFQVLPDRVIDLTPQLYNFGFRSIRQIASDGQSWLVIGDSSLWRGQPDLAYHFDGVYWKNLNHLMGMIPEQDWVGRVTGKGGLWLIPTQHHLLVWHAALNEPALIVLPDAFKEPRISGPTFYAVQDGWVAEFVQQNGPKSIAFGTPQYERRFFFFDGQEFSEISSLFNGLSATSVIGSNGQEVLVIGVAHEALNRDAYYAFRSNGKRTIDVTNHVRDLFHPEVPSTQQPFLTQGTIVWTGAQWMLSDSRKNMGVFDNVHAIKRITPSVDVFLDAGYGSKGQALFVGYAQEGDEMRPKMVLMQN